MPGMKYIYFRSGEFVIFPSKITHDEMAERMIKGNSSCIIDKPVSAGFCEITSKKNEYGEMRYNVRVFGESLSLKLKACEEHGKMMSLMLDEK